MFVGQRFCRRTATLLFLSFAVALAADSKAKTGCKVYFIAVEDDEITVGLKMIGLNKKQKDWYQKDGNLKDFAGVCSVNANESGVPVPMESGSNEYIERIVGEAPLYMIAWEEHRVFVPDETGGHYAYSANGILSRMDRTAPKSTFVPVGPIHATNRTVLSSSSVSLLKNAIRAIRQKEHL